MSEDYCPDCQVEPGVRHDEGCDVARCAATGTQFIQCIGELHEHNGRTYGEHEGECKPTIWRGEWPGKAECRELGWYAEFLPNRGWKPVPASRAGELGVVEDLNRLISAGRWDATSERFVIPRPKTESTRGLVGGEETNE